MNFARLRTWGLGAVGAAINSAAGAGALVIVKPEDFNPFNGGLADLLKVSSALAIAGFYLYLRQHPIDLAGEDQR